MTEPTFSCAEADVEPRMKNGMRAPAAGSGSGCGDSGAEVGVAEEDIMGEGEQEEEEEEIVEMDDATITVIAHSIPIGCCSSSNAGAEAQRAAGEEEGGWASGSRQLHSHPVHCASLRSHALEK